MFPALVFWLRGMWDLGSLFRDQSHTPCLEKQNLDYWISREVPKSKYFDLHYFHWLFSHLDGQLKKNNCRIICFTLLCGFCHITVWISHKYVYIPSLLNHPLTFPLHSTPLGCHRAPGWALCTLTATSHWLTWQPCQSYAFNSSHLLLPLCPKSVLYVCISIPTLQLNYHMP